MKSRVAVEGLTIVLVVLSWVPLEAQDVRPPLASGTLGEGGDLRRVSPCTRFSRAGTRIPTARTHSPLAISIATRKKL